MPDIKRAARNRNKQKIFKLILEHGEISRSELSRLCDLTRPTVSAVMRDLIDMGWVTELGKGESSGGKRPMIFQFNKCAVYAIGFDVADEYLIRGVLCDFTGKVCAKVESKYENRFSSIIELLQKMTTQLTAKVSFNKVRGIGIAVSGIVDNEKNEVVSSTHFNIGGKNMAGVLSEKVGIPVFLENRPNAAVLAENRLSKTLSGRDMVYMTSGRGVGSGIISRGQLFRGSFGAAGEIGRLLIPGRIHDVIDVTETGTLEYQTRQSNILAEVRRLKKEELEYRDVLQLYCEGDPDIEAIMNRNAEYLAYGAAIIANLINPEVIVLGGKTGELGEKYLTHFQQAFNKFPGTPHKERIKIRFSTFGRLQPALGGAVIILDKTIAEMAVD
jgi:predicted NBD/HSP70 family sugar kinase